MKRFKPFSPLGHIFTGLGLRSFIALIVFSLCFAALGLSAAAQDNTRAAVEADDDLQDAEPFARNSWKICNQTSFSLRIATATMYQEKLISKGWDKLVAGQCMKVDILEGGPRLIYAESSPVHWGGIREWKGTVDLCALPDNFEADNTIACDLQDMTVRRFLAVDPKNPVTTLVEPAGYGKKAQVAGIQRLLKDNGYNISRVDGISGRRTLNTLSQYLKDNKLPTNLSVENQLRRLEETAGAKIKNIGLTVCNKSSQTVWAAIGMRHIGDWISKGWWKVDKDACVQPFTDTMIDAELFFYAQQASSDETIDLPQSDRHLRTSSSTPNNFCVAESRFSALGREDCADNGYRAANFRALPTEKAGMTLELTDADFAEANQSGLRR